MGRNAKFYKSTKANKKKKEESSTQAEISRPLTANLRGKRKSKEEGEEGGEGDTLESALQRQSSDITNTGQSINRFKSKMWKELEAKRAKEGKKGFATPKEAGIDYLGQWDRKEKKRR